MLRWCWLVVPLAACSFRSPNGGGGPADGPDDGPSQSDAPTDTRSALCFGSFMEVCLAAAPGPSITVNSGETRTIDTQLGSPDCAATMSDVGACVVAAASITVNGTIRGTGARPLVLLAAGSIAINSGGLIDVASHRGVAELGAGANPQPRCVAGSTPTVFTGGWGGSNATKGGDGNRAGSGSGGGNAASALPRPAAALFGGCPGSKGAGNAAGSGGAGGGAADLIAATIIVDGTINASGAGAGGANNNGAGGGGAGAGGLIVLDAPDVTINGSAQVLAQGGGGGEGGPTGGGKGGDGTDPTTAGQAAPGGSNGGSGGDGGDGATTAAGANGGSDSNLNIDDGGGGGGGGGGFIITTDPTPPGAPTSRVCPAFS
jgi:hypothetical protein